MKSAIMINIRQYGNATLPTPPAPPHDGIILFIPRQDFVGWSGVGPIALLIENILGIQLNGLENKN